MVIARRVRLCGAVTAAIRTFKARAIERLIGKGLRLTRSAPTDLRRLKPSLALV
jgi:hypothetical protein